MASVSLTCVHIVLGYGVKVGSFLCCICQILHVQPVVTKQRMQAETEKQNKNAELHPPMSTASPR